MAAPVKFPGKISVGKGFSCETPLRNRAASCRIWIDFQRKEDNTMKKALLYSLSLALLLSLTACRRAQQPAAPAASQPAASEPEVQTPAAPEQLSSKQLPEITRDELLKVFEEQYTILQSIDDSDSEETIQNELFTIQFTVEEAMEKSLPDDFEAQYRAWRSDYQQQQQDTQPAQPAKPAAPKAPETGTGGSNIVVNEEDRGTIGGPPSNVHVITDPSEIDAGGGNIYENADKVTIGYGGSEEDRGTTDGWDSFGEIITDPSELYTGIKDPFAGYGDVKIGYGGDPEGGGGSSWNTYKPGGSVEIEDITGDTAD